jgi:hypothetical protein
MRLEVYMNQFLKKFIHLRSKEILDSCQTLFNPLHLRDPKMGF